MNPQVVDEIVERALAEDVGTGDVTTEATVAPDARARAPISRSVSVPVRWCPRTIGDRLQGRPQVLVGDQDVVLNDVLLVPLKPGEKNPEFIF